MLILTRQDLGAVLKMEDVIDAVERGFCDLAHDDVIAPERLRLDIPSQNAVLLEMPAFLKRPSQASQNGPHSKIALGTKVVSVFEKNAERGLDAVQAAYLLMDAETGATLSLMDGKVITATRTAATSAVATKHMAGAGTGRLAVFGAGVQADYHIEAMIAVSIIRHVMIVSRNSDRARELASRSRSRFEIPCEVVSPDEAASTSDLICACTSSPTPLFDGRLVRPGTHVNAVGAFTPTTRELDGELVRRARVIIDAESAAGREAGEIIIPMAEGFIPPDHVKGTLADVVTGRVAGREHADEITLFKSCGLAIEDLVTAQLAYEKAKANSLGIEVEL